MSGSFIPHCPPVSVRQQKNLERQALTKQEAQQAWTDILSLA